MSARDDYPYLAERELYDTTGETALALDELDRLREIRRAAADALGDLGVA